jgi:crossover junction endodeoxyribonuclease RuvC
MRVLGIDPGLQVTGYGMVRADGSAFALVEAGVVRSNGQDELPERLRQLHAGVAQVLQATQPDAAVVEEIHSRYEHPRTAILMGHARGVICLACAEHGVPLRSYTASEVKRSLTGNGRASKEQVRQMVQRLLGLGQIEGPSDVGDALALALCHDGWRDRPNGLPGRERA